MKNIKKWKEDQNFLDFMAKLYIETSSPRPISPTPWILDPLPPHKAFVENSVTKPCFPSMEVSDLSYITKALPTYMGSLTLILPTPISAVIETELLAIALAIVDSTKNSTHFLHRYR